MCFLGLECFMRVWKAPTAILCLREVARVFWPMTCVRKVKHVCVRVCKVEGKYDSLSHLDYGSSTKVSPQFL